MSQVPSSSLAILYLLDFSVMTIMSILELYARSIAHKIRTPLSVISNELHFCDLSNDTSSEGKKAVLRSLEQCRMITLLLDEICGEVQEIGARSEEPQFINEIVSLVAPSAKNVEIVQEEKGVCVTGHLPRSFGGLRTLRTLSQFFLEILERDSARVPLLDLQLLNASIKLEILVENEGFRIYVDG